MAADAMKQKQSFQFVVVGGGIAGVTCVERLFQRLPSGSRVALVTAGGPNVKTVQNLRQVSKTLEEFSVAERPSSVLEERYPNLTVVGSAVVSLSARRHALRTADGREVRYEQLCICSGARAKLLLANQEDNPLVLGIRDTNSARDFQKRLSEARRIVVVGNGGIALELVYAVRGVEVVWAVRDDTIGNTFFDAAAAHFLIPSLLEEEEPGNKPEGGDAVTTCKRVRYTVEQAGVIRPAPSSSHGTAAEPGSALGPDWHQGITLRGAEREEKKGAAHRVTVEYGCEVDRIYGPGEEEEGQDTPHGGGDRGGGGGAGGGGGSWPVYVRLTNGRTVGCDLVVSATGVSPNTEPFLRGNGFVLGPDGGLRVDERMATSEEDVYAAGDVCSARWGEEEGEEGEEGGTGTGPLWQQMRLWSQARQMGWHAASCMVARALREPVPVELDFCFELFAHVTRFFGHKVVLLGRFNGQGLAPCDDQELLLRITPGVEYVKAVLSGGRMVGAVLIGETDLEETFENLILNRMDLTPYREDLLNPNIDLEDYFD